MMDNSYNSHNFSQEDDSMFTLTELWGMVWGHKVWYVVSEDSLHVEWYSENPDDPYYNICYAYKRA